MKVAIAHDSLVQYGGAERTLEALHEIFPEAPIFTLAYDKKLAAHFEGWTIISSPLQHFYNFFPRLKYWLAFIPLALRFFDFSEFDLVISSSSAWMKGIRVPKKTMHINYCHTPTRFLWLDQDNKYLSEEAPVWLRPFAKLFLHWMRKWDYRAAQRVDYFVANSHNVQERIKKFYGRNSEVIYPFANTEFFHPTALRDKFYLVVARLHAHKKVGLVIEVFNQLKKELHIIGTGRAEEELKKIAGPTIQFLGRVDDEILRNEYSAARGFINPQEEDLGLTPIEANACGTAVIAYGKGGALETVVDGRTGILFYEQTNGSLTAALQKFELEHFLAEDLFEQAEKFSKPRFKANIMDFVEKVWRQRSALVESIHPVSEGE